MGQKYIHFTSLEDAKKIIKSGKIWQASFGPEGSVFGVVEGGAFVPSVQMTNYGRPKIRSVAVVFETDYLPGVAFPEEVMWHMNSLPIKNATIVSPREAATLLNDSISQDDYFNMLKIPLHPAFNDWGEWTRMPESWKPWTPGVDNDKYLMAKGIWDKTKDIKTLEKFWNEDADLSLTQESTVHSLNRIINSFIKEVFE